MVIRFYRSLKLLVFCFFCVCAVSVILAMFPGFKKGFLSSAKPGEPAKTEDKLKDEELCIRKLRRCIYEFEYRRIVFSHVPMQTLLADTNLVRRAKFPDLSWIPENVIFGLSGKARSLSTPQVNVSKNRAYLSYVSILFHSGKI